MNNLDANFLRGMVYYNFPPELPEDLKVEGIEETPEPVYLECSVSQSEIAQNLLSNMQNDEGKAKNPKSVKFNQPIGRSVIERREPPKKLSFTAQDLMNNANDDSFVFPALHELYTRLVTPMPLTRYAEVVEETIKLVDLIPKSEESGIEKFSDILQILKNRLLPGITAAQTTNALKIATSLYEKGDLGSIDRVVMREDLRLRQEKMRTVALRQLEHLNELLGKRNRSDKVLTEIFELKHSLSTTSYLFMKTEGLMTLGEEIAQQVRECEEEVTSSLKRKRKTTKTVDQENL